MNSAKLSLGHPFSRIKRIDQWEVYWDRDPVLTITTWDKTGKTAISDCYFVFSQTLDIPMYVVWIWDAALCWNHLAAVRASALRSWPIFVVKGMSAFACFGAHRKSAHRPGALSRPVSPRKGAEIICSPASMHLHS